MNFKDFNKNINNSNKELDQNDVQPVFLESIAKEFEEEKRKEQLEKDIKEAEKVDSVFLENVDRTFEEEKIEEEVVQEEVVQEEVKEVENVVPDVPTKEEISPVEINESKNEMDDVNIQEIVPQVETNLYNYKFINVDCFDDVFDYMGKGYFYGSIHLNNKKECQKLFKFLKKNYNLNEDYYFFYVHLLFKKNEFSKVWSLLKKFKDKDHYLYNFYFAEYLRVYKNKVKKNQEAIGFYKKSSLKNFAPAFYRLSECYYFGDGVEVDKKQAFAYIDLAALQGDTYSIMKKAEFELYSFGCKGDKKDAFNLLSKLVEDGYTLAKYNLGICYMFGYGVEENHDKGLKMMIEAYRKDNVTRCFIGRGIGYLYGFALRRKYLKAKSIFKKGAKMKIADSYFFLGMMKYNGYGFFKNKMKALEYFEKGKSLGSLLCSIIIEERYRYSKYGDARINRENVDKIYYL